MSLYYLDVHAEHFAENSLELEKKDPSLNGQCADSLRHEFRVNKEDLDRLFLSQYGIDYVSRYFSSKKLPLRVATHPHKTNTCFEKAELLGAWNPLNVIKALYFEHSESNSLYAVVVPETGCFIDRANLRNILNISGDGFIRKAVSLPRHMSFGTCSPFISREDLKAKGGRVEKIFFDAETLASKKNDSTLDDFSFGLDHRMSIQMSYVECFKMLKKLYPDIVAEEKILGLSFKEKLSRINGKIHISYEFNSLNYRTTQFLNSIHGYGDVSIYNDYVDELDLPNALNGAKRQLLNHEETEIP
jgi:hypothetical protein